MLREIYKGTTTGQETGPRNHHGHSHNSTFITISPDTQASSDYPPHPFLPISTSLNSVLKAVIKSTVGWLQLVDAEAGRWFHSATNPTSLTSTEQSPSNTSCDTLHPNDPLATERLVTPPSSSPSDLFSASSASHPTLARQTASLVDRSPDTPDETPLLAEALFNPPQLSPHESPHLALVPAGQPILEVRRPINASYGTSSHTNPPPATPYPSHPLFNLSNESSLLPESSSLPSSPTPTSSTSFRPAESRHWNNITNKTLFASSIYRPSVTFSDTSGHSNLLLAKASSPQTSSLPSASYSSSSTPTLERAIQSLLPLPTHPPTPLPNPTSPTSSEVPSPSLTPLPVLPPASLSLSFHEALSSLANIRSDPSYSYEPSQTPSSTPFRTSNTPVLLERQATSCPTSFQHRQTSHTSRLLRHVVRGVTGVVLTTPQRRHWSPLRVSAWRPQLSSSYSSVTATSPSAQDRTAKSHYHSPVTLSLASTGSRDIHSSLFAPHILETNTPFSTEGTSFPQPSFHPHNSLACLPVWTNSLLPTNRLPSNRLPPKLESTKLPVSTLDIVSTPDQTSSTQSACIDTKTKDKTDSPPRNSCCCLFPSFLSVTKHSQHAHSSE